MEKTKIDETKTTGASLIITFYTEIGQLRHHHAKYVNLLTEIQQKTKDTNLDENDKKVINDTVQTLRYYIIQTHTIARAILTTLKQNTTLEKLNKTYQQTIKDYLITRENANQYLDTIMDILLNEIIKSLLQTSTDIMKDLYDNK